MSTKVIAQLEKMVIPTYPEAACEELPMFAENRVHQRSSGNPYPNKVMIKTREKTKIDKEYDVIKLENDYIELVIIPEIGGRIFSAKDKTTGYDFFYRQNVIKPALIGALGSWISGGVEFNWPYHHRPSTFMPVDYEIEYEDNGAVTVWCSEHDPIDRMKGMVGIRLEPDKAMFETRMKVTNRTPLRHSFLWWENTAVPVNPEYEIFFPSDVDHVHFHYRRSNTTYPIAKGMFNGYRFEESGVDISKHINTKFSTSFFCAASDYDYFGGYDNGKKCGVVHIGDHHVSTGKKMFTWAYNQLSQSWERHLTDSEYGSYSGYAELMAGSYTNNQPDFAWLEPYETKNFSQFWYPLSALGVPSYADLDYAINVKSGLIKIQPVADCADAKVTLTSKGKTIFDGTVALTAGQVAEIPVAEFDASEYEIRVNETYYEQIVREQQPLPDLFPEVPMYNELHTAESRYIAGMHFLRYRDPKADPDAYFKAALEIDPEYIPALTALGETAISRGEFAQAKASLEAAVKAATKYCYHMDSGKTLYLLAYANEMLGNYKVAYDLYRKSAWSEDSISASMTRASMLDAKRGEYKSAVKMADTAISRNTDNAIAAAIAAIAQYKAGNLDCAKARIEAELKRDKLNHLARYAAVLCGMMTEADFYGKLNSNPSQTCLDIAFDMLAAGFEDETKALLSNLPNYVDDIAPTVAYMIGRPELANEMHKAFPSRPQEIAVLEASDSEYAKYLLGCLHFARKRYDAAYDLWKDINRYEAKRNVAAYFWKKGQHKKALAALDEAIALNPAEEELVYEKGYLLNKIGYDADKTVAEITALVPSLADARDDIVTEWAAAFIRAGKYDDALYLINNHIFTPCEGGETIVAKQHMNSWYGKGKDLYAQGEYEKALEAFRTAQVIPDNLGAGLWHVDPLVPSQYYEALTLEKLGHADEAAKIYEYIAGIHLDFFSDMYLAELPIYEAMSLKKLDREDEADALLTKYIDRWQSEMKRVDSGYFAQQPFFISYLDDAKTERDAYYNALLSFAYSARDGMNDLLNI